MWTDRLRKRGPPPVTYWDEYVATDEWYVKELLADVPPDELHAAMIDEDFSEDGVGDATHADDEGRDASADEADEPDESDESGESDESDESDAECTDGATSDETGSDTDATTAADSSATGH